MGDASELRSWWHTGEGEYVLNWARASCERIVADVFGFHALQLGFQETDFLAANRIPVKTCLAESGEHGQLRCAFDELPFANQSIDLVLLPFTLDFHPNPHQVLREVERILRPEGQVVILGFNPWSLWGLARGINRVLYALLQRTYGFPWQGRFISIPRLRDWLELLGFEVDRGGFGCYIPPCASRKTLARLKFLELAGNRWWGFAGGTYALRAVKRVKGLRLMPPWSAVSRQKLVLKPGLTAGSTRLDSAGQKKERLP